MEVGSVSDMDPFTIRELTLVGLSFLAGGMIPWLFNRKEWSRQQEQIKELRIEVGILKGLADVEKKHWTGTQAEYDALLNKDPDRSYDIFEK